MAILILEATGPNGEALAMAAGKAREIPVGWDPEFGCGTFDADGIDEAELQAVVYEPLAAIEPDWQSHLRLAE